MSEKQSEALLNFADALENAALVLKQAIGKEIKPVQVNEAPFLTLKWEKREGAKLREFEITTKALNSGSEDFEKCFNILKRNNASINQRFHDKGWQYGYWLYGENAIYRQTLKK